VLFRSIIGVVLSIFALRYTDNVQVEVNKSKPRCR